LDFDISFLVNIAAISGAIFGGTAFIWKVIDSQKGYLVSGLECSHEVLDKTDYIIAKTSLKNVGKKGKKISIAYLLLLFPHETTHDDGIRKIYDRPIEKKPATISIIHKIINHIRRLGRIIHRNQEEKENDDYIPREVYDSLAKTCEKKWESKALPEIRTLDGNAIFRILVYYTKEHSQIGESGRQSSRTVLEVPYKGIWSVYFGFIGIDWPKKRLDFYTLHQDVIVQNIPVVE